MGVRGVRGPRIRSGRRGHPFFSCVAMLFAACGLCAAFAADAATTVGTMAGDFSVNLSGSATYNIPIELPPGVHGMKPDLAIAYNSSGGSGELGQGWSLGGISMISRCPETLDQDGMSTQPAVVDTVSNSDRFCLDGERLIRVTGSHDGDQGSTYHTEIESFKQVTAGAPVAAGSCGAASGLGTGPATFTTTDRAGHTSTYGDTVDSTLIGDGYTFLQSTGYVTCQNPSRVVWPITHTTDQYGNFVSFQYYNLQTGNAWNPASFYVKEIDYGSANGASVRVVFNYDTGQTLNLNTYYQYTDQTFTAVNPALLTSIQIINGASQVLRTYNFSYSTVNNSIDPVNAHPAELASIQECGSDGSCYNPTTFVYQGFPNNFTNNVPTKVVAGAMPYRQVLDLDGDGLPDYVYCLGSGCASSDGELYVAFGNHLNGTGTDTGLALTQGNFNLVYQNVVVVSLYGDGKQQLMIPYCSQTTAQCYWKELSWNGSSSNPNLVLSDPPVAGGGQLTVTNTGYGNALGIDLTGSGRSDLLTTDSGYLYYYLNTPNGFDPNPVKTTVQITGNTPRMYQVNYTGSGLPEIYIVGNGIAQAELSSNGAGVEPTVSSFEKLTGPFSDDNNLLAMFVIDADGDGLSSLVRVTSSGDPSNPGGGYWYFYPNTGTGWDFTPKVTDYAQFDTSGIGDAQPVDWYGDGREEMIVPSGSSWYLLTFGQGPSYGENGVAAVVINNLNISVLDSGSTLFIDADGDGQFDMLYTSGGYTSYIKNAGMPYLLGQITNGLGLNTYIGYITPKLAAYTSVITNAASPELSPPRILPYTGFMYLVRDFAVDSAVFTAGKPQQIYTYYKYGAPVADAWGRGFLGYNEVETINYNTGIYSLTYYHQAFPYQGIAYETDKYWNPSIGSPQPVQIGSSYGGLKVICTREDGTGAPDCAPPIPQYEPAQFDTGGTLISKTTVRSQDLTVLQPYSGVYFPYAKAATVAKYDPQTGGLYDTVQTAVSYQIQTAATPIGNDVVKMSETTTNSDASNSADQSVATIGYGYGQESVCPGAATSITVTDTFNESSPITYPDKTEALTYDSNCFLTKDVKTIVAPPGSNASGYPLSLELDNTPDVYGNSVETDTHATGAQTRKTLTSYDASERFPSQITNPLGQVESITYNPFGKTHTDTDANRDVVRYTYDGFDRVATKTGPEPQVNTTWAYAACAQDCVSGGDVAYAVTQTNSDGSSATTQYDELARPVRTVKTGFNGSIIFQDTAYDALAHVIAASKPYLSSASTSCWEFFAYDVLNRVIRRSQPSTQAACAGPVTDQNDRVTTTGYDGFTTTATITTTNTSSSGPSSEVSSTVRNVLGSPGMITDAAGGQVTYSYDPWKNLVGVTTPKKYKVGMSYDSAGNKLGIDDPDMGAWSYSYDGLGELLSQTNSNGQTVTDTYDELGRLVQRAEPEGINTWQYDVAYGAGIGRLAYKVAANGAWEGYAYDGYGHPTDKITVVNGQEYWVTSTYDAQGRVYQLVYPDMNGISASGAPAVPTGFNVVTDPNNNAAFAVSWVNVQDGAIYHLFRAAGATAQTVAANEIYAGPDEGFYDTGITSDGQYTWTLEACNGTDCSTLVSVTLNVTLPPTVPGAPTVPADNHSLAVTVSWSGSSLVSTTAGPISYVLMESSDGVNYAPVPGGAVSTTSGNAPVSTDGINYTFEVRACASGACSAAGPASNAYVTYIQPSYPQNIVMPASVTPSSSPAGYTVSWSAPASVPTSGVIYVVQVENQLVSGSGFTTVQTSSQMSYPASQTQDGIYLYQVKACNQVETSVCSSYAQNGTVAVTLPPTLPGSVSFTPPTDLHGGIWEVIWGASTVNSGSATPGITYYLDEELGSGGFSPVYTGTTANSGYLTHVTNGTYYYEVKACTTDNATGGTACTPFGTVSSGYTTVIAPPAPTGVTSPGRSNGDGSFTITLAESPGGIAVTNYVVELGEHDGETNSNIWGDGYCSSATKSCTFSGGLSPMTYIIEVAACDTSVACSNWYPLSTPYPKIVVSYAPTGVKVSPNPSSNGSYTLSWSQPQQMAVSSYDVYESVNGGSYAQIATVTATSSTSYSYPVSGKGNGTYRYYVTDCYNSVCSPNSAVATETVSLPPVPGVPSLSASALTVNVGDSVTLSWAPNGGTITGYVLQKEYTAGFVGIYSGTARSFATTISGAGDHWFRVEACNSVGCSAWSGTVDVYANGKGSTAMLAPARNGVLPDAAPMRLEVAAAVEPLPSFPETTWMPVIAPRPPDTLSAADPAMELASTHVSEPKLTLLTPWQIIGAVPDAALPILSESADAPSTQPAASRLAYALAHPAPSSRPGIAKVTPVPQDHLQWPPRAIDPRLSLYPPLRQDARVAAHFQAEGGALPARAQQASSSEPATVNALMVEYQYNDPAGYLTAIVKLDSGGNPLQQLWVADDVTPYGQVDQTTFDAPAAGGAGTLQVNDSYDAATGMLDGTQVTAGVATQVYAAVYDWDGYGNLKDRSLTQNSQPLASETFGYDALNHLRSTSTTAGSYSSNPVYAYDTEGSTASNGGYTDYQYNAPGYTVGSYTYSQPHAVSSVTLPKGVVRGYQYDQDGNLKQVTEDSGSGPMPTRQVDWYSFDKPMDIKNLLTGAKETFTYEADHERLVTSVSQSSGTDTTTYIDGLFESEYNSTTSVQTYRHYVLAGATRVAVETITANGQGQMQSDQLGFFIHDQVGSAIGQVTENPGGSGQQLSIYSYNPWGKGRPTDATGGQIPYADLAPGQFIAEAVGQHEGFAAHENLPSVGLVEMEGRIYDPEVGRFLSADPSVQFPFSTQGYNRYTYVNDNPLTFEDPTGYDLFGGVGQDLVDIGTAPYYQGRDGVYWVDRRISPQEFAVANMVTSGLCGPLRSVCSAANTYQYERANGVPADEAIRAAIASAVAAEASGDAGEMWNAGDYLGAAAVAYMGGFETAHIEGGDGLLGGRRALLQLGLQVAMEDAWHHAFSGKPAANGGQVKPHGAGSGSKDNSQMGIAIHADPNSHLVGMSLSDVLKDPQAMKELADYAKAHGESSNFIYDSDGNAIGFAPGTEGWGPFQWSATHLGGVNGFSVLHDQWMQNATNSLFIKMTIPPAAFLTYWSIGGYSQYELSRNPDTYH